VYGTLPVKNIGMDWNKGRWIEMEVVGIKRVLKARLIFVCDTYIDYIERTSENKPNHGFANIDSVHSFEFTPIDRDEMKKKLKKAIKQDKRVDLLIEVRVKKGSEQKQYYLIKVD